MVNMNVPPPPNLKTPNPWENIPEGKRVLSPDDIKKLEALRDKKIEDWTAEDKQFYNERYQGTASAIAPEKEVIERDLKTQKIHQLRQSLTEFNQAREKYAALEDKKTKTGLRDEYVVAKKFYETKRADYNKNSIRRFLYEDSRLERTLALGINPDLFKQWVAKQPAGSFQEDLTESLPDGTQKVLGKIFDYDKAVAAYQETQEYSDLQQRHKVWEKVKQGYKWLGDQNLEKWTGHQAKTKFGKFLMRTVSARTLIGVGLFGAGVGAATMGAGLTSAGLLGFRRIFSGASSAIGVHEGTKGLSEHWAKTKGKESELKAEEIVNLSKDELRLRLQHFELSARKKHEDVSKNEAYQALKEQYKERLETEIKQGKVTDEVIKAEIEELDETFASVKAQARNKAVARATLSAAFGVAVGAGLLGKIIGKGVQEVTGSGNVGASGLTQEQLLQYGQEIDRLSAKFFGKIPNVSNWPAGQVSGLVDYLHNLEHSFGGVKASGQWGPDEWRAFMNEHQDMFAGQKVPSAEEISAHLAKDSVITTVAEGQGIETKGIQQIMDDPRKFGYAGDLQDIKSVKSFAGKLAHEAALNTQAGDKAVAGVTSGGQAYDLRLKSGAIGDKVLLEQGSDGKWHYKFSEGLAKEDLYQHVAKGSGGAGVDIPSVQPKVDVNPLLNNKWEVFNSLDGNEHSRYTMVHYDSDLPDETEHFSNSDLRMWAGETKLGDNLFTGRLSYATLLDRQNNSVDTVRFLADDHRSVTQQLVDAHNKFAVIDKNLTVISDNLPRSGDKLPLGYQAEMARWAGVDLLSKGNLTAAQTENLSVIDKVVNGRAGYFHETDFKDFLKENYKSLSSTEAGMDYAAFKSLRNQGFANINMADVHTYANKPNSWLELVHDGKASMPGGFKADVVGGELVTNLKSPLSGEQLNAPLAKSQFNMETLTSSLNKLTGQYAQEYALYNGIKSTVGENNADYILSLKCGDATESNIIDHTSKLFGLSDGGGDKVYEYLHKTLGADYTGKSGTVGEELSRVTGTRGIASQSQVLEGSKLAGQKAGTELSQNLETVPTHKEISVNGGKLIMDYDNKGNLKTTFNGMMQGGVFTKDLQEVALADKFMEVIHQRGSNGVFIHKDPGFLTQQVEMTARVLHNDLKIHESLVKSGHLEEAKIYGEYIKHQVELADKSYGKGIFEEAKVEAQLNANNKAGAEYLAAKNKANLLEEDDAKFQAKLRANKLIEQDKDFLNKKK